MCGVYQKCLCAVFNRSSIYFWLSSFFDITKVPNAYETKRKSHNNNGGDQENVTGILPYNVMQTIFSSRLANVWMKNFNDALDQISKCASLMQQWIQKW